jgi:thiamine kinase-like enzyme
MCTILVTKEIYMEKEIPLKGGRITSKVTKKGNYVYRSCCENSMFVHKVLKWLENKDTTIAPHFIGLSGDGREIITFLNGYSPNDLGEFSGKQLYEAGKLIKYLHTLLSDYPACKMGQTVCHNDLSPCNFMFLNKVPYAVFDWDNSHIGDPMDDLAYAVWMWCDIGNEDQTDDKVKAKIKRMIQGYNTKEFDIRNKIINQMNRVGNSKFSTMEQTELTKNWTKKCKEWIISNEEIFYTIFE